MSIFRKFFSIFFLALFCLIPTNYAKSETGIIKSNNSTVADNTTEVLFNSQTRLSIQSAVKIQSILGGHGTGTYAEVGSHFVVLTAAHVVDDSEIYYVITQARERVVGQVIWVSKEKDMAALRVPRLNSRTPVSLSKVGPLEVGQKLLYTGYPASYELLTSRATVSGRAPDFHNAILMQGFVWFGYSGSGAFDASGRLRAVVVAIGVESFRMQPHPLETLVYAFEVTKEDIEEIKASLKNNVKPT
tara:strand:+ start:200 stop:934 length:735 start_codon:yes stop_codon:yes gene_type:complete